MTFTVFFIQAPAYSREHSTEDVHVRQLVFLILNFAMASTTSSYLSGTTDVYNTSNNATTTLLTTTDVYNTSDSGTEPTLSGGPNQQQVDALTIAITVVIAFVMVGMGCAVDIKIVLHHMKKPSGVIIGVLCQFGGYKVDALV